MSQRWLLNSGLLLFTSSQKARTIISKPTGASSNFYTSNCFKYRPNNIFSHLDPTCFAHPAKLYLTYASHR